MKKKSTIVSVIGLLVIGIAAFVFGQINAPKQSYGAFTSVAPQITASSSAGTYFHKATQETQTGTTTLLTLDGVFNASRIGLNLTVKNATDTVGSIYILPESSTDATVWQTLTGFHLVNGAAGAFVSNIAIGNGSSTILEYTPNSRGTTSVQYWFAPPLATFMRFQVWTSGTSSVLLEGIKELK